MTAKVVVIVFIVDEMAPPSCRENKVTGIPPRS
jgi:hypothetical protein